MNGRESFDDISIAILTRDVTKVVPTVHSWHEFLQIKN